MASDSLSLAYEDGEVALTCSTEVGDDREVIQPGDTVVLIVENDLGFCLIHFDNVREKGSGGLVTSLGAVALALFMDTTKHCPAEYRLPICRAGVKRSGTHEE